METKKWTLYIHTNKINGKKYIGITSKKPEERWQNGAGYRGQLFGNAIKKYGWDNFNHEIITVDDENTIKHLEMYYIRLYKTYDRKFGYNISMGGDGWNLAPEELKRIRKEFGRRVYQYTTDGEYVRTFDSVGSVSAYGFSEGSVRSCINGRRNSHKGFLWSATELTTEQALSLAEQAKIRDIRSSIYQYDAHGEVVRVLKQCVDFGEYGLNHRCISACLKGDIMLHKGYMFFDKEMDKEEVIERFKALYGDKYRMAYRYSLDGELLDFDIIKNYALKEYGSTEIKRVCDNESISYKGFIWSYEKLTDEEIKEKLQKVKKKQYEKIYQYKPNGELVSARESINSYAKDGFSPSSIKTRCEDGYGEYKGFVWSFTELTVEQVKDAMNRSTTKKYLQYSMDGELIHSADSLKEYEEKGFKYNSVREACSKKCGYHNGFIWSKEELTVDEIRQVAEKHRNNKEEKFYQYNKNGEIIKIYNSRAELKEMGFDMGNVTKCCKNDGRVKTVKGYVFSNTELSKEDVASRYETKNPKTGIKTYQYDLQGKLIDVQVSASKYKEKGFNPNAILECCKGKRKTHGGYRWSHTKIA